MYFLIIQLKEEKYLEDILLGMTDIGVHNAIIQNAVDMSSTMAFDIPIFAGFREEFGKRKAYSKVIWALVENEDAPEKLIKTLEETDIKFIRDELGKIILIPVVKVIGLED
ncbi:MAG TPA: hypothetical protein ENN73_05145 [Firmicutes bacterium]|nr:hypothetical protein [Bacillota bacterium]